MLNITIKTNDSLLNDIKTAAQQEVTRADIEKQRISYVYGFMGHESTITRSEVKRLMEKQEGK